METITAEQAREISFGINQQEFNLTNILSRIKYQAMTGKREANFLEGELDGIEEKIKLLRYGISNNKLKITW